MEPNINQPVQTNIQSEINTTPPVQPVQTASPIPSVTHDVVIPKKKSYSLIIVLAVLVLLFTLGFAGYTIYNAVFAPKDDNIINNGNNNNQNDNVKDEDKAPVETKTEFEKKLGTVMTKGDEYMFFNYDNDDTNGITLVMTLLGLESKKEVLRKEIKLKVDKSEFLNSENSFFDNESGDVYFSTNSYSSTDFGEYCDLSNFPQTSECTVKVYKTNFLSDTVEEVYKKKDGYLWTYDKTNNRLIVKEFNSKESQFEYKSISLADKSVKLLGRITGINSKLSLLVNGQLNIKNNKAYDILSKYNPDVYTQSKYLRITDLSTSKWTEELIPSIKSNAIFDAKFSNDMSKVSVVYSMTIGDSDDFKLTFAVYDITNSKLLVNDPSKLTSPVINLYASVSNSGHIYFNAEDEFIYAYDSLNGTVAKLRKGHPNLILNSQDYLIISEGLNKSEKVYLYDLSSKESYSLKSILNDFNTSGTGMNLNSYIVYEVQ